MGVLLVGDRAITRAGVRAVLGRDRTIEVVGEAADGPDAERRASALGPQVVLVDAQSPGLDVVRLVAGLAARPGRAMPGVLLMVQETDDPARQALRAGARGAVLSRATPEQLLSAIHMVAAGYAVFEASWSVPPAPDADRGPAPSCGHGTADERARAELLTRREREVLALLARGLSNAEMSAELVVGESTVKSHVQHVLDKLELRNRVHAVIYALRTGLVPAACGRCGPRYTAV
ncbi:LuxR C-terminal-related transcriptional regulator [Streptomyces sp. OR43]|uniref:LuxR C-terminal-related transcriptional regulator n=1 Tax=Streptomyces sp. or43 TaxID=2478957 RepID=UPI0016519DED|nr:response regulator transcription factor [Streptomyces sp. or43]